MNVWPFLYALYIFIIVVAEPLSLYVIVIPDQATDNFYWIPFASMLLTNVSSILTGITSIIFCAYVYLKKKRYFVWNTESGTYQAIYEGDLKRLLNYNPGNLIPKSPRDIIDPESKSLEEYTVKVSHDLPRMTVIIAAYLANERTIIEETLIGIGKMNYPGPMSIVLAYNTLPFDGQTDLLLRLQSLTHRFPTLYHGKVLHVINCEGCNSKAQNINYILDMMAKEDLSGCSLKGERIAIYDADHQPEANSLIKAVHLMRKKKADILHGRCIAINNQGFLSGLVGVEFDLMYVLRHKGGEILRGLGFFGGSNGIWTYEALSRIRMNPSMLAEDIDASFRAIEAGYKIIYSNNVISYELCPASLYALARQRIRWAQGWFQVTLHHTWKMLRCPHVTFQDKITFLVITIYREIFYYAAAQILPIFVISLIKGTYAYDPLLWISTTISCLILPISLLVVKTYLSLDVDHIAPPQYKKLHTGRYIIYMIMSVFYQYFMFCVTVLSHFLEFSGNKEWRITQRTTSMANVFTPIE